MHWLWYVWGIGALLTWVGMVLAVLDFTAGMPLRSRVGAVLVWTVLSLLWPLTWAGIGLIVWSEMRKRG